MKKLFIAIPLLLVFIALGIANIQEQRQLNQNLDIQLDQKEIRIKNLQQKMLEINKELDEHKGSSEQDQERIKQLEQEKQQLEKDLQAKLERERQEVIAQQKLERASNTATGTATASASIGGSKQDWLRASGIPESQWWAVDYIVSRESSWNPNAVNKSSGACGLGQQLPCGKWAGAWNDPVAALKAQYGYVNARYGGYPQAVAFWQANHWY